MFFRHLLWARHLKFPLPISQTTAKLFPTEPSAIKARLQEEGTRNPYKGHT